MFLDELLLYINRLMPFAVAPATGVLSELLKVLFGRNITVTPTPQIPRNSPHHLSYAKKDIISKSFEDFAYYLTKLSTPGSVEEAVLKYTSRIQYY